jgi:hypothetical protein
MLAGMQGMRWLVAAAWIVIGCGGAAKQGPGVGNGAGSGDPLVVAPAAGPPQIADIEARLLGARAIAVDFHIASEGAYAGEVKGDLRMTRDNQVRLRFSGVFDGKPVSVDKVLDATSGAHLSEAVVIGMVRMGLLHNIAQLATGHGIDHAGGGVAEWVTVKQTTSSDEDVGMEITVSGQAMGVARLEVDGLGLPRERTQTVQFSGAEMRVEEHYSTSLPDAIDGSVFADP